MGLKEIIKTHKDKLDNLEEKDHNKYLWNAALFFLFAGLITAWFYGIGFMFLGFIIYGVLAYRSVKW